MRVRLIEREIDPAWTLAMGTLTLATPDVTVARGDSLIAMPPDDFYLWVGRSLAALERDLSELASHEPDRCARTVVLGLPLDFMIGERRSSPGTLVHLLESYHLAGAFGPEALTLWQEAPSSFAGPKNRMAALEAAPVKAFQTKNYANWFAARGATLADFLFDYLRAVDRLTAHGSAEAATETSASRSTAARRFKG